MVIAMAVAESPRKALSRFIKTQDAWHSGDPDESASGNGSIMRLAPVPIRYHSLYPKNIPELVSLAEESSLTTHASEQCLSACRYMAFVLSALIHGEDRNTVLSPTWEPLLELSSINTIAPTDFGCSPRQFQGQAASCHSWIGMGRPEPGSCVVGLP